MKFLPGNGSLVPNCQTLWLKIFCQANQTYSRESWDNGGELPRKQQDCCMLVGEVMVSITLNQWLAREKQ
ncbi:MAG: hypothetical protein P5684_09215 [Limnospira sp. PMC 1238.20]|uniref:hypothetical protein n=1 Tax=unclassified Limnospira TaxID=2642885 RepID=UPI0028E0F777|nr:MULTISPECIES: hypothetical protein [unclassified Limnospira]MDT9177836.1 hypothetical protein [Limnospira sp. PMC 1238.20]MDT9229105.1 hypothetical protein [Limnospira sp. PMC 1242.20]MDT9239363.1 hypothetical protein [Limnospira sp. PMC 1261.20]MDT9264809.1 hypothetical protein [Limnospira sp. PMC 1223.20]